MDADDAVLRSGVIVAVLLAGFFLAGFAANTLMTGSAAASTPTGKTVADHPHPDESSVATVSHDAAAQNAIEKLRTGPFSYPFTYNLSVVSVNNDTRIPGTTFYETTISYVVEPNPFKGQLYSVPANKTRTTKTLTVYVSQDGKFLFQNAPISTEVQQQRAPSGVLPR